MVASFSKSSWSPRLQNQRRGQATLDSDAVCSFFISGPNWAHQRGYSGHIRPAFRLGVLYAPRRDYILVGIKNEMRRPPPRDRLVQGPGGRAAASATNATRRSWPGACPVRDWRRPSAEGPGAHWPRAPTPAPRRAKAAGRARRLAVSARRRPAASGKSVDAFLEIWRDPARVEGWRRRCRASASSRPRARPARNRTPPE